MSERAKQLFDAMKELAPGLKNFGPEIGAEISRLGTQGSMELASALFNGDGFVPYGPGQYTPDVDGPDQDMGQELQPELVQETGREL